MYTFLNYNLYVLMYIIYIMSFVNGCKSSKSIRGNPMFYYIHLVLHCTHTCVACAASPSRTTIAMKLLRYQQRWWLCDESNSRNTTHAATTISYSNGVHCPTFSTIGTWFSGTRIKYHITVCTTKSFRTRACIPVRSRALTGAPIQAWFVSPTII